MIFFVCFCFIKVEGKQGKKFKQSYLSIYPMLKCTHNNEDYPPSPPPLPGVHNLNRRKFTLPKDASKQVSAGFWVLRHFFSNNRNKTWIVPNYLILEEGSPRDALLQSTLKDCVLWIKSALVHFRKNITNTRLGLAHVSSYL